MSIRNFASRPEARLSGKRHARSVVARQGQVLLDVDLNSEAEAISDRVEVETLDTLGQLAVPFANAGFAIGAGGTISAGRLYLDGLLVENPDACALNTQPHPADALPAGPAIVGMKALVRLIDPVEDRRLADKALADAAASGRAYVDWQVFPVPVQLSAGAPLSCAVGSVDWDKLVLPSSGRLSARVDPGSAAADFCTPAATGGFTRLENLLYRVEVDGGVAIANYPNIDGPRYGLAGLRLKFSQCNASVITRIVGVNGRELQVDPPALDLNQWFSPGGAAEIVSVHDDVDPRAAASQTRLFTVASAAGDRVLLAPGGALPLPASNQLGVNWYLRLWDTLPDFSISTTTTLASGGGASNEIDLGDGVLVKLHAAVANDTIFRRSDYWSFIARVDGTIDWPESAPNVPIPATPHGPRIHYARLAVAASPSATPTDCRPAFLPLTAQNALHYAGGDGQAAFLGDGVAPEFPPFVPLRGPLSVLVLRGGLPVQSAQVQWQIPAGAPAGQINGGTGFETGPVTTTTDATGHTVITWALDSTHADQIHWVEATLVLPAGQPAVAPIRYSAGFDTAARTSYQAGACDLLADSTTVQQALDKLCNNIGNPRPDTLILQRITLPAAKTKGELIREDLILNASEFTPVQLEQGIVFTCDRGPIAATPEPFDPIVDVILELPYPVTDGDHNYWQKFEFGQGPFATLPFRLDGQVSIKEKLIVWEPNATAKNFLHAASSHLFGESGKALVERDGYVRILTRIVLRSQFVWIEGDKGEPVYLNAEHLGVVGPVTHRELAVRRRDPQQAGDLNMFVYLLAKKLIIRNVRQRLPS